MRTPAIHSLTAALLVLFTATSAAHAATPKACELLDAQTAASLVGSAVGAPVDAQGVGCGYSTKSGSATVGLTMGDAPGNAGADLIRVMKLSAGQGAITESLPDLGEQNFLLVRPSNQNGLMVVYHHKILSLAVQRHMTPELKAAMIQAMRKILSKI